MTDFKLTNIQTKIVQVKLRNIIEIHRSLKHKVITNQIHNKVAEANSFKTTHTFS
jgi:hypothetical protein